MMLMNDDQQIYLVLILYTKYSISILLTLPLLLDFHVPGILRRVHLAERITSASLEGVDMVVLRWPRDARVATGSSPREQQWTPEPPAHLHVPPNNALLHVARLSVGDTLRGCDNFGCRKRHGSLYE